MRSTEVVVIGGGVIGLSAACECQRLGHRVLLIERDPVRRGSSLGNAGMIVPSHVIPLAAPGMVSLGLKWMWNPESPFYVRPSLRSDLLRWGWLFVRSANQSNVDRCGPLLRDLHLASRQLFLELAQERDFGLKENGLLMLCKSQSAFEEEAHAAEQAKALGVPAEALNSQQVAQLDGQITMDIVGGIYFPKDCHLQPDRMVTALQERFLEHGGEVLEFEDVSHWKHSGRRLQAVVTSTQEIEADQFILAGGVHSMKLGQAIGLRLPMQAGKGYSLTLPEPVEQPKICSILTEARVAVTPMGNSLRFGGTMEIAGMDDSISPRRIAGILKSIPKYFPRFSIADFDGVQPWCGLRPCSPDGMPYLGRTKRWNNLIVATGHAMMGLSLAPITGRLVGELIEGRTTSIDIGALSPDRFG